MKTPWETFFRSAITKIFTEKKSIVDIGGGLRILKEKNNRYAPSNEWIREFLPQVDYKVLDPVDTYHPDIVGDIHNLPFSDNSIDAVVCIAVLEHVENPFKAMSEMYRVLKKDGYCFLYVPFLYYYHAERGYYGDYWRFTPESLKLLSKPFSSIEIENVRGAFETWVKLSPLGRITFLVPLWRVIDMCMGKVHSKQTSGYYVFLKK